MADRIPLIVNPGAAQIQELPTGDTLTIGNGVQITGNLSVAGISSFTSGTVKVTKSVQVTENLNVTGITTTQDDLVVNGKLRMQGTALGSSDIILSGGSDAVCMIANQNSVSNLSRIGINCHNNANDASLQVAEFSVGASNAVGFKCYATQIDFTNLPTSNPGVAGRLWRSGNDVKISTG